MGPLLLALHSLLLTATDDSPNAKPNILWITCEDIGPHLGAYGCPDAETPNLDALASRSLRFDQAFSNAPVCAPARTTLITGMYPTSLGAESMRSLATMPTELKFFTEHLREAGYFCTNHTKEDYNLETPSSAWDLTRSKKATYDKRNEGQPFFSVINLTMTHESRIWKDLDSSLSPDPDDVEVPPYYPDTMEVRRDLARYHTNIRLMDREVGLILDRLSRDGLSDETIVFFFSDHGSGMPRGKRWLYDSGLHVPLIVHVPEAFRDRLPEDLTSVRSTSRLVSFVDFAPTVLSLCGLTPPSSMQGHAFLGAHAVAPRSSVFGYRSRMDERYDLSRSIRTHRYLYIRNFMPDRPQGQYLEYMFRTKTTQVWRSHFDSDRLSNHQKGFFALKSPEELYDVEADPHQVTNLANDPRFADVKEELRNVLRETMLQTRDLGLIPEQQLKDRSGSQSPYAWARGDTAPDFAALYAVASNSRGEDPEIDAEDPAFRFWAWQNLHTGATLSENAIGTGIADRCADVRVAVASWLCRDSRTDAGLDALMSILETQKDSWASLRAAGVVDRLDLDSPRVRDCLEGFAKSEARSPRGHPGSYLRRVAIKALADLEEGR